MEACTVIVGDYPRCDSTVGDYPRCDSTVGDYPRCDSTVGDAPVSLEEQLIAWVALKASNGIKQHSRKWLEAKKHTIGGSSIATIAGENPYKSIEALLRERIGYDPFISSIKMQWGNLFEEVIKRYVEAAYACRVHGEDLYVEGGPAHAGIAYSPDGLAVMNVNGAPTVVLLEFKCPYSRIPTRAPTAYYIPQVKMGLDVLDIASVGMLLEAVFRRCMFSQLGDTPAHDTTLVADTKAAMLSGPPLVQGIIGIYVSPKLDRKVVKDPSISRAMAMLQAALAVNSWVTVPVNDVTVPVNDVTVPVHSVHGHTTSLHDLGAVTPPIFANVIDLVDRGALCAWYGAVASPHEMNRIGTDLVQFNSHCSAAELEPIGVLPWKCFHITTNYIKKEPGWLTPHMPKVQELLDISRRCNAADEDTKRVLYNTYVGQPATASPTSCYSDGW